MNKKLAELSVEELAQVSGGVLPDSNEHVIELPGGEIDFYRLGGPH